MDYPSADGANPSSLPSRRSILRGTAAAFAMPLCLSCERRGEAAQGGSSASLLAEDFRRPGDSDLLTLRKALREWGRLGGTLVLGRNRTYDLGRYSRAETLFALRGLRGAVLDGNGATLKLHTAAQVVPTIIKLSDFSDVTIANLGATDSGYDPEPTWRGANFIVVTGEDGPGRRLRLHNLRASHLTGAVSIWGAQHRVTSVYIRPDCQFEHVYYAFNCQENGDDVTGGFTAVNSRRAYFPYGVSRHDLVVNVNHNGRAHAADSAVLIKRYHRNTADIRLTMNFSGVLAWESAVTLEHQPDPGTGPGRIDRIELTINVAEGSSDPNGMTRLAFRSYGHGGREETGVTDNMWESIELRGRRGNGTGADVVAHVRPRKPATIRVTSSALGKVQAPGFVIQRVR